MEFVKFALRDFRHDEFEALWRIDQQCFEPGISYSRLELATYLRRSGAFTLVADAAKSARVGVWAGPRTKAGLRSCRWDSSLPKREAAAPDTSLP